MNITLKTENIFSLGFLLTKLKICFYTVTPAKLIGLIFGLTSVIHKKGSVLQSSPRYSRPGPPLLYWPRKSLAHNLPVKSQHVVFHICFTQGLT